MNLKTSLVLLLLAPALWGADSQWVLDTSTLTYHISHPLHQSEGVSHAARGKGICQTGQCNFLIAVPVKSFNSGDSNRDLHMVQVTRGAEFPMVSVRVSAAESTLSAPTIHCDVEIEFAGQKAQYKDVVLQVTTEGNEKHVTGTIPATLADFKIDPPSLVAIPVKNEMPIRVDLKWKPSL